MFFEADIQILLDRKLHYLIIGTAAIAAFGYWLNDFYDQYRDSINKPHKKGIRRLGLTVVIGHLVIFSVVALLSGYLMNLLFLYSFGAILLALWLYNLKLKDVPLMGNIIISMLCFLSIYMVSWLFPEIDIRLLLHFGVIAALLTWCRELVKDAEDVKGDGLSGSKTIAVTMGTDFTNKLVYFSILFVISFVAISVYYQSQYFAGMLQYVYWGYYLFFIVVPLYKVAIQIRMMATPSEYNGLSKMLKYVIFTGILSILFF
ncbi:MAG: UbiA family prenyltransferase [Bacteroidia bacterium]